MKVLLASIALFVLPLIISGCGFADAADNAEKTADKFHALLVAHNHDAIIKLLDEEALEVTSEEEWKELFAHLDNSGDILSVHKKVGFNSEIKNGETRVELNYTLEFFGGEMNETIYFIERGNEFKITGYQVNAIR